MKAGRFSLIVFMAIALSTQVAVGMEPQIQSFNSSLIPNSYRIPAGSFIPGGRFGWHSSTAQEGMARGMADVIRARGQAALLGAQAATETEVARRKYLENRTYAAESYIERRKIQKNYGEEVRAEKRASLAEHVKRRELQPLTSSEFYEETGKISWPIVLTHENFEKGRLMVEELFSKRAADGLLSAEDGLQLYRLLKTWESHVPSYKDEFPNSEIQAAVRFLQRLQKLALRNDQ
ncbi:MAG: hypothetical protein AAF802_20275 [Planctomycetota bacterium]